MFPLQLEGVPPARLHEGEERGEEDLRGPQGVDGHLRDRLQVQVRQACKRPPHLRSPLLLGQGKSPFFYVPMNSFRVRRKYSVQV